MEPAQRGGEASREGLSEEGRRKMRCPSLPLCGLLCVWLPLFYSRPVKIDKVKADTKNLTRTIIARIQEHQLFPLNLKINGLDFIPGERPLESLDSMDETLQIFQRILPSLPMENVPVAQIFNDIENLRSLIQTLGSHLSCTFHKSSNLDALGNLTELLTTSPYTTAVVALDRLQKCLHSIVKHLDHIQSC
ncbi:leptin [Mauremys reevesii]|uniref:leptin n=1 Tax=Mauremys reevesii TaxID=260615 RepID=UPI00194000DB|nr:leptin [Mauremys reevesii]